MQDSPPLDALVQDTLENLVRQFSQALCFYRELIQNALDANSNRVEVTLEFEGKGSGKGTAVIRVDDWGEGMNRAIIDTQLTRLFSSTKENDFTKIGKFGVGFVSVFALAPRAVIVDTSRDGESWRVIFHEDRTFDRLRLDHPVDGTKVRILKPMAASEFAKFIEESRTTVTYWCRHSEVPVLFQGTPVNEPFDLDLPFKLHHAREGTEVVLGLTGDPEPFFGFYNGGITLLEGTRAFVPGVAFKMKSRYLEHTITRDNVIQDENYDKAMSIVEELARGELLDGLVEELVRCAAAHDLERHDELVRLGGGRLLGAPPKLQKRPLVPLVDGRVVSLAAIREALPSTRAKVKALGGAFRGAACDTAASPLTEHFAPVVRTKPESGLARLLERLAGEPPFVVSEAFAQPVAAPPPEGFPALAEGLARLLESQGVTLSVLHPGCFEYPGSTVASFPLFLARSLDEPSPVDRANERGTISGGPEAVKRGLLRKGPEHLVLNVRHPYIVSLLELARHDALLAAYLFCRVLFLQDGLDPAVENRLIESFIACAGSHGA